MGLELQSGVGGAGRDLIRARPNGQLTGCWPFFGHPLLCDRLERLCKARNVNWTVDYFYNPTFVPVQKQSAQPLILPPELPTAQAVTGKGAGAAQQQTSGGSGKAEKDKPGADSTPAPSTAKSKQQRKAEKAAATATAGKGKASAAKQDKQDKQRAEGGAAAVSKLQLEDGAAAGPGPGSLAQAMAGTPQFRGPKALFKQWKIMQQQGEASGRLAGTAGGREFVSYSQS